MNTQSAVHAAKHAGINVLLYTGICLAIAVGYVAYDTNGFTKPPSWWSAYHSWSVDPVVAPKDIHDPTPGASK